MLDNGVVLLKNEEGRDLVRRKCAAAGVRMDTLEELVAAEFDGQGKKRKAGLYVEFDRIFDEVDAEESS